MAFGYKDIGINRGKTKLEIMSYKIKLGFLNIVRAYSCSAGQPCRDNVQTTWCSIEETKAQRFTQSTTQVI